MNAKSRYDELRARRDQYLDVAVECSRLTLPYLIRQDESQDRKALPTPGKQSVLKLSQLWQLS